uniref:Reverse transcriptase Ty1/copia-type domain-containing protein n=1 Tax=Vitis vinifera TaxID=29760 RepID=A5C5I6_VITVI|nr:hypothetical protein VITISV_017875 [Vitis vinifera]
MYVDDILVTSNDSEKLSNLKTYLAVEFEIKDLGTLQYFLCIEVARLKLGEGPNDTPVDKKRYRRLVGKLIYVAHTHLNITFVVSMALVKELGLGSRDPMELYRDNKACLHGQAVVENDILDRHLLGWAKIPVKVSEGCRRTQMEFDHAISLQHGNLTMDFVGALSSNETKETQRKPEFRLIMGLRDLIWFNTVQMDFATIPTPRALFYQINIDFPFLGFFVLLLLFRPFRIVVIAV